MNLRKLFLVPAFLSVSFAMAACGPSESAIQTAIAQTETAKPTAVPTLTPAQVYAREMQPGLDRLPAWIEDYDSFMALLDGVPDIIFYYEAGGGPILSYRELLMHHWLSVEYIMVWDEKDDQILAYLRKFFLPTDDILEIGRKDILSIIATTTPASEIEVAHKQVVACIQYKIDYLNAIVWTLAEAQLPDFPDDAGHCDVIEASVAKVNQFVLKNQ